RRPRSVLLAEHGVRIDLRTAGRNRRADVVVAALVDCGVVRRRGCSTTRGRPGRRPTPPGRGEARALRTAIREPGRCLGGRIMNIEPLETTPDPALRLRRTLEGIIGVPATEGNRIEPLRNGDAIFPAMLDAIEGARHTIDMLTFVYWEGRVG